MSFKFIAALEKATGVAVMPAPRRLDDTGGIAQSAIIMADLQHPDPRLNDDAGPCFLCHAAQDHHSVPFLSRGQYLPPPALNDPCTEGGPQQGASHQGASPPGLDLSGILCFF